jgi:nitrite reductase/ring-hydroxylating ferredoxin subunit
MPEQSFFPPRGSAAVPCVGTYRRLLPVSLERLYENALDWEHLPHQHAASFSAIDCLDWGAWGWRAAVVDTRGRRSVIELSLDRDCRRWITRALDGHGAGGEIWTRAVPAPGGAAVEVLIDFFVPGVAESERARVGRAYADLYARLYDEDVAMMVERQRQLDRRLDRARDGERSLDLGARGEQTLPRTVVLAGREFVLAEVDGALRAFPAQCPHMLGPLDGGDLNGRVVTCPWHGDRFDVVSGDNLSGRLCRLSHLPEVVVDDAGRVRISATH